MGNQGNSQIKFGYWGIRGRGQILRLLLAYSGLQWTEIKYSSRDQYLKDSSQLGLEFPNLPYLVDGDYRLTQSKAIASYIIQRSGKAELLGKNIKDSGKVECLNGVLTDIRQVLATLIIDSEWKNKISETLPKIQPKLDQLQKFYGEKQFALGYLTLVDFTVSEYSYYVENVVPELYSKYKFLKRVRDAIENLPEIKKYYQSETAVKAPFFPQKAAIKF